MYIYIYIYIYTYEKSVDVFVYSYSYTFHIYIYIYICIYTKYKHLNTKIMMLFVWICFDKCATAISNMSYIQIFQLDLIRTFKITIHNAKRTRHINIHDQHGISNFNIFTNKNNGRSFVSARSGYLLWTALGGPNLLVYIYI